MVLHSAQVLAYGVVLWCLAADSGICDTEPFSAQAFLQQVSFFGGQTVEWCEQI